MRAWQEKDTFAFNGRYNQQRYVNIWPRPVQSPHPPIWIPGGGSVETWQWCAEMDYVYCYLSYYGYKAGQALMDVRTFGGEMAAHSASERGVPPGSGQFIGVGESRRRVQGLAHRHKPVEMRIEHAVAAVAARKTGQGRHDDGALLGQRVQDRHPARHPAEPGQEAQFRPGPLAPDARGEAVDVDRRGFGFAHPALQPRLRERTGPPRRPGSIGGRPIPPPSSAGRPARPRAAPVPSAAATSGLPTRRTGP